MNMNPTDKSQLSPLGQWLDKQRSGEALRVWLRLLLAILGGLALLNIFILPHEPHFGLDKYPFFWAIFGLGFGVAMVILVKKIIQPVIVRSEDFYNDL